MQLTIRQIIDLYNGLSALDGYNHVVKDEAAKTEKVVFLPYSFSGKVRYSLNKGLTATKRVADDLNKVKDAIIKEVTKGGERIDPADTEVLKAFNVAFNEALDHVEEISLFTLTVKDLNLDVNQIPISVLSVLSPIITDTE